MPTTLHSCLCLQMVAYLYGAGTYLFTGHYFMPRLHLSMARFLEREGRMAEGAYHHHQRLVLYRTIFDRYMTNGEFTGLSILSLPDSLKSKLGSRFRISTTL